MHTHISTGAVDVDVGGSAGFAGEVVGAHPGLCLGGSQTGGGKGYIRDEHIETGQTGVATVGTVPDGDLADVLDGTEIHLPPGFGQIFGVSHRLVEIVAVGVAVHGHAGQAHVGAVFIHAGLSSRHADGDVGQTLCDRGGTGCRCSSRRGRSSRSGRNWRFSDCGGGSRRFGCGGIGGSVDRLPFDRIKTHLAARSAGIVGEHHSRRTHSKVIGSQQDKLVPGAGLVYRNGSSSAGVKDLVFCIGGICTV